VTGDIFEGITPGAISLARPEVTAASSHAGLSAELAGPWDFYTEFRRAHALTHLPHPEPPEIALQAGATLVIPIWLRNDSVEPQEFTLSANLPAGWTMTTNPAKFTVGAKQTGAIRPEINLPAWTEPAAGQKPQPQEISIQVQVAGQSVGEIKLRVELRKRALPE
jgi:hypothetical protein